MPNKRRLKKKRARERLVKKRVQARRADIREEARLKKEVEDIQWELRDRITPIRNPKNDEEV